MTQKTIDLQEFDCDPDIELELRYLQPGVRFVDIARHEYVLTDEVEHTPRRVAVRTSSPQAGKLFRFKTNMRVSPRGRI